MRAEAARNKPNDTTQVNVVVITSDFSLLSVLQQAAGPEHSFWQTSSADAAVDLLVSGRRGILILDLATLSGNLTSLLYRLELQFPELVVLATGTREQESSVVSLVGKGRIYRFLHKPVSPARAGLFLGTATRRYLELRGSNSRSMGTVRQLARERPGRLVLISVVAGVLVFAASTAALLMIKKNSRQPPTVSTSRNNPAPLARQPQQIPVSNVTPAAPAAVDTAGMLSRYLAVAQGAYSAGRLTSPPGNNALEYYQSALRLQQNNAEALLGIERINITLETRVTKALRDSDAAAAAQALDELQQARPDAPQLAGLRARVLELTQPAAATQPAQQPTPAAPSSAPAPIKLAANIARPAAPPAKAPAAQILTPNIEQARNRIRIGQLVEPADNSALFFLRQAQEAGEDPTVLKIAATDLGQRLLDSVRSAGAASQSEQAQRLLNAATELDRQFGLALPDLDAALADSRRATAAAIEQARAQRLAAAVQLRESGQLIEPAGASAYDRILTLAADFPNAEDVRAEKQRLAAALVAGGETALSGGNRRRAQTFADRAAALAPTLAESSAFAQKLALLATQPLVVSGNMLPRIREVAPRYPRIAERDGLEGSVDVEFTIAPDGTTRDLVVRDSNPKKIFDEAAIEAVSKWIFKPVIRDGEVVSQRTIIKIKFSMTR